MANKTSLLQRWLESVWYGESKGRLLLMPLSYLYSLINNHQRKTQSKNLVQLPCPVIVVGNITVGGTGKTPLTIHLVQLLQKAGYKPAIITRGYGGTANTWPQAVNSDSDASLVGDEAVLMAQRTGIPVFAGADRLQSIDQLLKAHDCDVIVSDDGMQHYKLPRDIQIAVIDGKRRLGNGYCLPAGPLREKRERLKLCDFIVMNGVKSNFDPYIEEYLKTENYYEMVLSGTTLINLSTQQTKQISEFNDVTVQALTGIGNPQRFYTTLENSGLKLIKNSFPDHYAFTKNDLEFADDSVVIMTEKDAVKCKALIGNAKNYWYLPINAKLPTEFEQKLLSKLDIISESDPNKKTIKR